MIIISVSVLIPLTGFKIINETIRSVIRQGCSKCEILILRNDIKSLPDGIEVDEEEYVLPDLNFPIREIFIREKGKGNALNVGISLAHNDLICVLDVDCILDENALSLAMRHFADDKVVAVGGRLLVMNISQRKADRSEWI